MSREQRSCLQTLLPNTTCHSLWPTASPSCASPCFRIVRSPTSSLVEGPRQHRLWSAPCLHLFTRTWYSICRVPTIFHGHRWKQRQEFWQVPCHPSPLLHRSVLHQIPGHANLQHWNCIQHLWSSPAGFPWEWHSLVKLGWICVWQLQRHDRETQLRSVQNQGEGAICVWLWLCLPSCQLVCHCWNQDPTPSSGRSPCRCLLPFLP